MILITDVSLDSLRLHEKATAANATLGSYGMDKHCPLKEFRICRVQFQADDLERLFMIGEFAKHTVDHSGRLRSVTAASADMPRVAAFLRDDFDLRSRSGFEPIFVGAAWEKAGLTAIDGNHRMIAQFLSGRGIEGVIAFVCIHPMIGKWPFVPHAARTI